MYHSNKWRPSEVRLDDTALKVKEAAIRYVVVELTLADLET